MGQESLRAFLDQIENTLDLTEPVAMDDDCSVVQLAPSKDGLVGLDADTGRPMRVGWKYPTIEEKPVIIHVGGRQTVIAPAKVAAPPPVPLPPLLPQPPAHKGIAWSPQSTKAQWTPETAADFAQQHLPPHEPELPAVARADAEALYDAMRARFQTTGFKPEDEAAARKTFVAGCTENRVFYEKWQSRLGLLEKGGIPAALVRQAVAKDWPPAPRTRQRIVDT